MRDVRRGPARSGHTARVPDEPEPTADRHQVGYPDAYAPVVPYDVTFDAFYGMEMIDDGSDDGVLRARVRVRDELRQQFGFLHGGVIAAVAESLASRGTWIAVHEQGRLVMGMSNNTSIIAPLRDGHLHATAVARHRGESNWLWEVQGRDDDGGLCAITVVEIAIRPDRSGGR